MKDKLKQIQEVYDRYKQLKNEVPLAVSVIVENVKGQIVAVSRKNDHSKFGLPGGKCESYDYDMLDSCIRELHEETGLLYKRSKFMKVYEGVHGGYWQNTYYINVELDMDNSVFNYIEPHIVKWSDWQTVFDGPFGEYNRIVYDKLQSIITIM